MKHRVQDDELNTLVLFLTDHVRRAPTPTSEEAGEVGVFDLGDFRKHPQLFSGMDLEIVSPVFEDRHTLLAMHHFEPTWHAYDRGAFQVCGPMA